MSNDRTNIVFIGSSAIGLQHLIDSNFFTIVDVLCLESRINENLISVASQYGYVINKFKWIDDFRKIIVEFPVEMPFLIYQLDMLVPADLTDVRSFYNIHRGNLFTNRGPNPDIWPILNGDKESSLSLHKINEKIDSGIFIDSYDVSIHPDHDTLQLRKNLEMGLPKLILSLEDYLKGKNKGSVLTSGIYKPWIKESDFTIDLYKDSIEVMDRKIKSQRQYNGAIVIFENKKYYILDIIKVENISMNEEHSSLEYGDTFTVKSGQNLITFKINIAPKYPPPPICPPSKRI